MKITFGRIFELGLIAKTKAGGELQPFIEWVQQSIDNVARALVQNLTIRDNIDAEIVSFQVTSSTYSYTTDVKFRKRPLVLVVAKQFPTTPAITSFAWANNPDSTVKITVTFLSAPSSGIYLSLLAFFN